MKTLVRRRGAAHTHTKEIPMKQRLVLMLMVFAVVLTFAPLAMADHCSTCRFANCRPATVPAYYFCVSDGVTCTLSGPGCGGPHPFAEEVFAAEFTVASVERLDGRTDPAEQKGEPTRTASLETPAPSQP
jgi:hypothetical protein